MGISVLAAILDAILDLYMMQSLCEINIGFNRKPDPQNLGLDTKIVLIPQI